MDKKKIRRKKRNRERGRQPKKIERKRKKDAGHMSSMRLEAVAVAIPRHLLGSMARVPQQSGSETVVHFTREGDWPRCP